MTPPVKTAPSARPSDICDSVVLRSARGIATASKMPANGQLEDGFHLIDEPATYSDAVASSSDDETVQYSNDERSIRDMKATIATGKLATFESLPSRAHHEEFIKSCMDVILKEAVFDGTNRNNPVLNFVNPEELQSKVNFKLKTAPSTHEDLLKTLKDTIRYSVKTGHPYFVNQLFSSLDPYGLVGQWLTDALNPTVYTYEVSPVFTLMEEEVLREMRTIVGFKNGEGDGIFCPGGSMANGYAISCARHKFIPDIKVCTKSLVVPRRDVGK